MSEIYNLICIHVNNPICLLLDNNSCSVDDMKYGERLRMARSAHARLTQAQLEERMGRAMTQQNISKLEGGDATGSEFTVQIAIACGVRPEWLALEQGPMLQEHDAKIAAVWNVMKTLPEYKKDVLVATAMALSAPADSPAGRAHIDAPTYRGPDRRQGDVQYQGPERRLSN